MNYDVNVFNLNHNLSINYITLDKKDEWANTRLPINTPFPNIPYFPIGINNDISTLRIMLNRE